MSGFCAPLLRSIVTLETPPAPPGAAFLVLDQKPHSCFLTPGSTDNLTTVASKSYKGPKSVKLIPSKIQGGEGTGMVSSARDSQEERLGTGALRLAEPPNLWVRVAQRSTPTHTSPELVSFLCTVQINHCHLFSEHLFCAKTCDFWGTPQ